MKENKIVRIAVLFLFVAMVVIALFSEGSGYGGGDSVLHFLFSKYSFRHPELFLHHWGKPFFILISSSFAQFGFPGMNVFNTICSLFTAYFMYLLAKDFKFENSWMVFFFSLFAPIYFVVIFSGLTEIFFSFVLVLSIFLMVRKKYFLSSAIISFLPFVRTEGFLLISLFAVAFVYRKKFTALPALLFGTFVYSLIGGSYYHDGLWVFHQNPYAAARTIYGRGELFHFIKQNEFVLGTPMVVLFLAGIVSFFIKKKSREAFFNKVNAEELILIYGSFLIYFIAHSVFWWKGLYGSDGLIRVMAAITPLMALLSLRGANAILSFKNSAIIRYIIVVLIIWMPFKQHKFPRPLNNEEATLHKAGEWLRENNLTSVKIIYAHPFILYDLDKDPLDVQAVSDWYVLKTDDPAIGIPAGNLVIWDSHFCPNEGRIPLEKFLENKNFKMLNSFVSEPTVTPKGKDRFEAYIFQKLRDL